MHSDFWYTRRFLYEPPWGRKGFGVGISLIFMVSELGLIEVGRAVVWALLSSCLGLIEAVIRPYWASISLSKPWHKKA